VADDGAAALRDGRGWLTGGLSTDGLHLGGEGYRLWAGALRPRVAAALAGQ